MYEHEEMCLELTELKAKALYETQLWIWYVHYTEQRIKKMQVQFCNIFDKEKRTTTSKS